MGRERHGRKSYNRHEKRRESEGCNMSSSKPIFYIKILSEYNYNAESVKR